MLPEMQDFLDHMQAGFKQTKPATEFYIEQRADGIYACPVGAAMYHADANYLNADVHKALAGLPADRFPVLDSLEIYHPEEERIHWSNDLETIITDLVDSYDWSRDQIVEWLQSLDLEKMKGKD